jgi:hypothetical protein
MRTYGSERLETNDSAAESQQPDAVQKFLGGGIHLEDYTDTNRDGDGHIAHFWSAGGFDNVAANTAGAGATVASQQVANPAAGFSIVTWTGNNTDNTKIAHGLSQAPEMIIAKNRDDGTDWWVFHHKLTADKNLKLNTTDAQGTFATGVYDHSGFTSQYFTVSNGSSNGNSINGSGDAMIAYIWHGVYGYSKFGEYSGNGESQKGPFIYTGFRPKLVFLKCKSHSGTNWEMRDTARNPNNLVTQVWYPGISSTEYTTDNMDIFSNGFQLRSSGGGRNDSGKNYIYAAWAELPLFDGTSCAPAR